MLLKVVFPILAAVFAVGLGGMVGTFQDVDVNNEGAQNALKFAVVEHNRRTNDAFLRQVAEVIEVKRQVVSGYKYVITVKLGRTPCRKGSAHEECAIHQDPQMARPYQCKFTVWSQPWLDELRLMKEEC